MTEAQEPAAGHNGLVTAAGGPQPGAQDGNAYKDESVRTRACLKALGVCDAKCTFSTNTHLKYDVFAPCLLEEGQPLHPCHHAP